jgi:hypothetical protein
MSAITTLSAAVTAFGRRSGPALSRESRSCCGRCLPAEPTADRVPMAFRAAVSFEASGGLIRCGALPTTAMTWPMPCGSETRFHKYMAYRKTPDSCVTMKQDNSPEPHINYAGFLNFTSRSVMYSYHAHSVNASTGYITTPVRDLDTWNCRLTNRGMLYYGNIHFRYRYTGSSRNSVTMHGWK